MFSAITIADEMLKRAKAKGKALTPLQLMKLVYIAHGWSLGMLGRDLFPDRIEAWKYGPVIPDLYQATKRYGRGPIPIELVGDPEDSAVDVDTRAFLDDIFSKYGHLSGTALSTLTHKSGSPWHQVYEDGEMGIEIPDDIIRDHYRGLFDERKGSAAAAG